MFEKLITQTEFSNNTANRYFPQIRGEHFAGDVTFVSTLRALLFRRLNKDDNIYVDLFASPYLESADDVCQFVEDIKPDNCIRIISVNRHPELFDEIENVFSARYSQFQLVNKISVFYQKSFKVLCFICEDKHSVILFVEDLDLPKWHYLQCAIVAFLPWFFQPNDDKKGLTEDEIELIKALRLKSAKKYETYLTKIAEDMNVNEIWTRSLLSNFESDILNRKKESLIVQIKDNNSRITRYNHEIMSIISTNNTLNETLSGINLKLKDGSESEIMEYFLYNDNLLLADVEGQSIYFIAKGYCEYYDEDVATSMINNKYADIYDYAADYDWDVADAKALLKAIFIDQKIHIRFCAAYRLHTEAGVSGLKGWDFPKQCEHYMPNPHIDEYACLGQYNMAINDCLVNNDYIGAIAQCIASCKSLNFADSAVMDKFAEIFFSSKGQFLELPDGAMASVGEAIEFLNRKDDSDHE